MIDHSSIIRKMFFVLKGSIRRSDDEQYTEQDTYGLPFLEFKKKYEVSQHQY